MTDVCVQPFRAPPLAAGGVVALRGRRQGLDQGGNRLAAKRREMAPQNLETVDSAPGNGMALKPFAPPFLHFRLLQIFEPNLMKRLRRSPKLHVARRAPPEPPQKALRSW